MFFSSSSSVDYIIFRFCNLVKEKVVLIQNLERVSSVLGNKCNDYCALAQKNHFLLYVEIVTFKTIFAHLKKKIFLFQ